MMRYFALLVCMMCALNSGATHIVGGDIHIRWLGPNQYEFTVTVFRDCGPGASQLVTNIPLGNIRTRHKCLGYLG